MLFKTKYNDAEPYVPNIRKCKGVLKEGVDEPQRMTANTSRTLFRLENRDLFCENMERLEYTKNKSQIGRFSRY